MSLWRWLFPTPEDKLERARADLLAGRFNDARLAAAELDLPGAADVVLQATAGLCKLNLAHALSWAEAGDVEKCQQHLDLAQSFADASTAGEVSDARRTCRGLIEARALAAQQAQEADDFQRSLVDPRFHEAHGLPALPVPDDAEAAEELQQRLALIHESYPDDLRDGMLALGVDFSQAVLDLEDGQVERARDVLGRLPDVPLVLHERGRAAAALGDVAGAIAAWEAFGRAVGHREMGATHTGAMLAHLQARAGDVDAALATLRAVRKDQPDVAGTLFAALLEAKGELAQAEGVLRDLLRRHGPQAGLYNQLARVREAGGFRVEAMQALETALRTCGCGTGSCGTQPPDVTTYRMLATLYLEDGLERDRALELAETARALVRQPSWEDLYLATLAARARAEGAWTDMAARLRDVTPGGDPRRGRMDRYLAA